MRPRRSVLYMPGSNARALEKARTLPADSLILGYRQLIDRGHAHGLRVIGATILPYAGAAYYTAAGDAERAKIFGGIPLGRVGTPEEIAAPILFLCTPHAGFITGEVFNVNGGAVLVG